MSPVRTAAVALDEAIEALHLAIASYVGAMAAANRAYSLAHKNRQPHPRCEDAFTPLRTIIGRNGATV